MKKQNLQILLGTLLLLALSACGKIPDAYRGSYQDTATGAKLTLEGGSGSVALTSGRTIQGDADALEFDSLVTGTPGIYLRARGEDAENKENYEVFFLFPRMETRKEEAGFVWVEAEILYSRMNGNATDKVQQLKMLHCENGMLMLDLPTRTWNGGCPEGATQYDFVRKAE